MAKLPEWLNEELIRTTLEEETGEKIKTVKFHVENAAPPGSNYLTETLRIKVEFVTENALSVPKFTGYIVKIPFPVGFCQQLSNKVDFYSKEPAMYTELFPQMTLKLGHEVYPKSYHSPIKDVLFLKDLKEEGFIMMSRLEQLDFEHCREVMITIAKFHASSVACYHEKPLLIQKFSKEFFYTSSGPIGKEVKPMLENSFKSLAEVTKELGCFRFSDLLFSKVDSIFETSTKLYKPKETGLNVLVHGDLWTTNILFKHNQSGEVTDVKLIDYQLTRYMSPVLDLFFLIWTSANEHVREHCQEQLYSVYLETLNLHLEKLGCNEKMSAKELESELKSNSDSALILICNLLPFFLAPNEDYIPLGDVTEENFQSTDTNQYQKLFRGQHLISSLPKLAEQFMNYFYP